MILVIIKDSAIDLAGPLLTFHTEQQAIRALKEEANNPQSNIGKHPEDYMMYQVGKFDEKTGLIEAYEMPQPLARAKDFEERKNA